MAISSMTKGVCDKMVGEFSNMQTLLNIASSKSIVSALSSLNSQLTGMVWSSLGDLTTGISNFTNAAASIVPGVTSADLENLVDMINNCSFLSAHELFKNPIALVKGMTDTVFGQLDSLAATYGGVLPEFNAGNATRQLNDLLTDQNVSSNLTSMDQILNCVSDQCGSDYAAQLAAMTAQTSALYSSMKIVSNPLSIDYGKLDVADIYSTAGLDASEIYKMSITTAAIDTQKDLTVTKIDEAVDGLKDLL